MRGAGAVGSCLALALSRQGLSVALQREARPVAAAPREDVRAYALNAGSVQLLRELKVWDALPADARCAVYDMHVEGDAAGSALDFSAWSQGVEALAWIVDAAELERALAAAVSFAPHVQCVGDEPVDAALLALAEGKASATRDALGVAMPVQRYGQSAVAARLQTDLAHAGVARQWFRSPDVLALLPFDRPAPALGYGLVWSVPQARADELMALDAAAFEPALADATGGAAGTLRLCSERAAWPLTLARAEQVCGAGWVLLGDAAHVVHPLAGQGLNLGLGDVKALAAGDRRTRALAQPGRRAAAAALCAPPRRAHAGHGPADRRPAAPFCQRRAGAAGTSQPRPESGQRRAAAEAPAGIVRSRILKETDAQAPPPPAAAVRGAVLPATPPGRRRR